MVENYPSNLIKSVNRINEKNGKFELAVVCGAEGDRTLDLVNAIHALSQLSYSPNDGE